MYDVSQRHRFSGISDMGTEFYNGIIKCFTLLLRNGIIDRLILEIWLILGIIIIRVELNRSSDFNNALRGED